MILQRFNENWKVGHPMGVFDSFVNVGDRPRPMVSVDLPYDNMIHSDRSENGNAGAGCSYFQGEDVSYIKEFAVPEEWNGKVVWLEFEGVYSNSQVWVNGGFAGSHHYGYSNFYVRIDPFLRDGFNKIEIRIPAGLQPVSRWYSGSGIYRDVNLYVGNPLHICNEGIRITTVDAQKDIAALEIEADIEYFGTGNKEGLMHIEISDAKGNAVVHAEEFFNITSDKKLTLTKRVYVTDPELWDDIEPNLYNCHVCLSVFGETEDEYETRFGIRKLQLDPVYGLRVNGRSVKLKGGCVHHDSGILGAATFLDAELRRFGRMKEMGYNAIRSAHNPMGKASLEACDILGLYVMDELTDVWNSHIQYDYGMYYAEFCEKDAEAMVRKDYNHPCVILYSIGNEIPEVGSAENEEWGRVTAEKIRSIDKTRYITLGDNTLVALTGNETVLNECIRDVTGREDATIMDLMAGSATGGIAGSMGAFTESRYIEKLCMYHSGYQDIKGYNYSSNRYEIDHSVHPEYTFIGTETNPGVLAENWEIVKNHPYVLGDFCWTGWDYLGEVGCGRVRYEDDVNDRLYMAPYPWIASACGDFDIIGSRRPRSYWREIIWGGRKNFPYIAVQPPKRHNVRVVAPGHWDDVEGTWTWEDSEGLKTTVYVYTDADEIELLVNGRSYGREKTGNGVHKFTAQFEVTYEAGTIEALAFKDGKQVGSYALKTAGDPILTAEVERDSLRAGSNDLCYVNVSLKDSEGILNPAVSKQVHISVEGPVVLEASGSGNPAPYDRYFETVHPTYKGELLVILRAGKEKGMAKLHLSAERMKDLTIEIPVV